MSPQNQRKLPIESTIALLDANVFAIPWLFRDRRLNRLLRRRYHLATTEAVADECRRLGFRVPCFIDVLSAPRSAGCREQWALSYLSDADLGLIALSEDLLAVGYVVELVTFDRALAQASELSIEPPDWLCSFTSRSVYCSTSR